MARITKKYLGDNSVDANKVRFDNGTGFRSVDTSGSDVELFKYDSNNTLQFVVHPQIITSASGDNDVLTLKDLNQELEGLKPKAAVRAATTASITLSGLQTVDGVFLAAGDRVLVKDQASPEQNGIYDVVDGGSWVRSSDMDELAPVDEVNGAYTFVQEGTDNAGKGFVQTGSVSAIGTDPMNFIFFNSSSNIIGGDGISYIGSTVSVELSADPYLEFDSGRLQALVSEDLMTTDLSGLLPDALQVKEAIESAGRTSARESITVNNDIFGTKEVILSEAPIPNSIDVQPVGGPTQQFGVDYTVSANVITFVGDFANLVEVGDVIVIKYVY